MSIRSRHEAYKNYIEFVARDIQAERSVLNRRMFSVFLWCFLFPVILSVAALSLVKLKIVKWGIRSHLDWILLVFPVIYSLYFLGSEVLAQVPSLLRQGGGMVTLAQPLKQGEWRERVSDTMEKVVGGTIDEWAWIILSFKMDLQTMQNRTKFLTALAGAVFFLIMQGIDSISDPEEHITWINSTFLGGMQAGTENQTQFVGLALFLVLLYLSGSQTSQSLRRYLNCAELILQRIQLNQSKDQGKIAEFN